MTDDAAITARGLKKSFGRRPVLNLLDLTVGRGEALGLLGANGAGKDPERRRPRVRQMRITSRGYALCLAPNGRAVSGGLDRAAH